MANTVFTDFTFWAALAGIVPLLLLSAFFSGAETALTRANRGHLFRLSREGSNRAKAAMRLLETPDNLLGAILIGNNIVNILAASLATFALVRAFGETGVAIATLMMTGLVVVFAEVAPKTYAFMRPETSALRVSLIIRALVVVLSPVLLLVRRLSRGILARFGVTVEPDAPTIVSQETVRDTIALGHVGGAFVKQDRDMLLAALDLKRADVSDVMTHRGMVDVLDADLAPAELVDACLRSSHTRLPVYRGSHESIISVMHTKDLLRAAHEHMRNSTGGDLEGFDPLGVATKAWFIPDTTPLSNQLRAFQSRKSKIALVVDEYGDFQGVVTVEDIIEDIVGEIADEHDIEAHGIEKMPDGSYLVSGTTAVRELNRHCEWSLPEEPATTVAGLVIYESRKIPEAGDEFKFFGFHFRITAREGNLVSEVLIRPPTHPSSG